MLKMMGWDMDGTLCDTVSICVEAFRGAMIPYWKQSLSNEEIFALFGLSETGLVKVVVGDDWKKADEKFHQYYEARLEKGIELFPGIPELLNLLDEKKIKKVLVTGKGRRTCHMTLKKLGLTEAFEEICVGTEERLNKAEHFSSLIKKYGLQPEEFCYVGDAVSDVEACRKAGVIPLSAAWAKTAEKEMLQKIEAPYIFERVADLKDFLENWIR